MSESQPPPAGPGGRPEPTTPGATISSSTPSTPTGGRSTRTEEPAKGTGFARSGRSTSQQDPLRGSRTSGLWAALVASVVVLVLLIIFIAQNTDPVSIRFLGWEGSTPLAVAILAATVAGLFLAAVAGSLRILQLRRRVKRDAR